MEMLTRGVGVQNARRRPGGVSEGFVKATTLHLDTFRNCEGGFGDTVGARRRTGCHTLQELGV